MICRETGSIVTRVYVWHWSHVTSRPTRELEFGTDMSHDTVSYTETLREAEPEHTIYIILGREVTFTTNILAKHRNDNQT